MSNVGGDVKDLYPGARVFIAGHEMTKYVSSVTVNWTSGKAPSICVLEVLNENDRFIMTNRDILVIKGEMDLGETVNQQDFMWDSPSGEVLESLGKYDEVDGGMLDKKSEKSQIVFKKLAQPLIEVGEGKKKSRYYFAEGKAVFHPMDPVRVFFRDPEEPFEEIDGTTQERWYYGFAGFISDVTDRVTTNKLKTLRIVVEDVKRLLRMQVVSITSGYMDVYNYDQIKETDVDPSVWQNYYTGLSLDKIFEYALYGVPIAIRTRHEDINGVPMLVLPTEPPVSSLTDQERGSLGDDYVSKTSQGGEVYEWHKIYEIKEKVGSQEVFIKRSTRSAGKFDPDKMDIRWYGREDVNSAALEDWQKSLDCKVKKEDTVYMMLADFLSKFTREATPTTTVVDAITRIGENPVLYPIDGGGLKMLLPNGLKELGDDIIGREFNNFGDMYTQFKNKLDLIYNAASGIDFLFYTTPKGDVVVEFPMYDFLPKDYAFSSDDYMNIFTIEDSDLSDFDATDSDSEVKTAVRASQTLVRKFNVENKKIFKDTVVFKELLPLYGYRYIDAGFDRLLLTEDAVKLWAKICLTRVNSDAYSVSLPINFRPQAWIARPYLWEHRNHIGFAVSVSHTYTQASSLGTTLGLNYMRGWSGKLNKDGEMIYEAIGGAESRPFDYAVLFGKKKAEE